jgi:hypothetical protein
VFIFQLFIADVNVLVAVLTQLPKGDGEPIFSDCRHDPTQLVLKLSWDSKRPASSDFTLGKRKKLAGEIFSE